jgi:predicted AAA+ superfamily ATPase
MNAAQVRQILFDQKEELDHLLSLDFIDRDEQSMISFDSSLAQVVMGVRRAGKSILCINALKKSQKSFAYVNFDDEILAKAKAADLGLILEGLYRLYGDFEVLFIDEVQNVDEWHLFINKLLRQGMKILLTGSNSKLLSRELATHLTGRCHPIELFPFSFADYCKIRNVDISSFSTKKVAFLKNAFDDYMKTGGFPELSSDRHIDSFTYVNNLLSSILTQDIENRFKVRYKAAFENFANHLFNQVPFEISIQSLSKQFGFRSFHTTENYISYLKQAYLLIGVHKFSSKSRIRMTGEKAYPVDCSIMNNRMNAFSQDNLGWRLECIVLLELLKRYRNNGCDIYYYRNNKTECDFMVLRGAQVLQCIQVCLDPANEKTMNRELKGLEEASSASHCDQLFILTLDMNTELKLQDGTAVKVIPVCEWAVIRKE